MKYYTTSIFKHKIYRLVKKNLNRIYFIHKLRVFSMELLFLEQSNDHLTWRTSSNKEYLK